MKDYGINLTAKEEAKLDEMVASIRARVAKEPLTPRERIEAVQRGETPDRIPVWVNGIGLHAAANYGISGGDLYAAPPNSLFAYVHHLDRFGYDAPTQFRFSLGDAEFGAKTSIASFGVPFTVEGFIKSSCDIDGVKWPDPNQDGTLAWMCWTIAMLKEKLGDIMPIWGFITTPGLSSVLPGARDYQSAQIDLVKNPNLALALTGLNTRWQIIYGQAQLEAGADLLSMVDASCDSSPKQFMDSMAPFMAGLVHCLDRKVIWAQGGDASHVMEEYARAGVKNIQCDSKMPLDKIKEMCNKYGITLKYGISTQVLLDGPTAKIREEVKRVIEQGWPGGRFILSTDVLDAGTPEKHVDAFVDAAKEFGQLPLAY